MKKSAISVLKISLILPIISLSLLASSWHPEITHRPRTLFTAEDLVDIQGRLDEEPYRSIWSNNFGENQSIYNNARRSIDQTGNTVNNPRAGLDKRAWVSKDAAFVYYMNRAADGASYLDEGTDGQNPWTVGEYAAHSLSYLETLDPTVIGPTDVAQLESHGPMINNWQFRVRELISYCQAYDLLLGAGIPENQTVEANLASFANNLLNKYTATEWTNKYFLQRNNHKLTIGAALGMTAVVLNQHDDASKWINAGMLLIDWVCFGEPADAFDGYSLVDMNGGYAEGTHYMHYSWKKATPFFVAMKNFNGDWTENYSSAGISGFFPDYNSSTGLDLRSPYYDPRYRSIYEWAMRIRLPNGKLPVMEDSPINVYTPELAILSSEYDIQFTAPQVNTGSPPLVKQLTDLRSDYVAAGNHSNGSETLPVEPFVFMPEAGSGVFRGLGEEEIYLHINAKNGHTRKAAAAHDQADVSHFQVAFGHHEFSIEGGYAGWNYRYDVNKAENHNIILVDGFGPMPPSGPSVEVTVNAWPPSVDVDFNTGNPSMTDGYLENHIQSATFSYLECHSEYGQGYVRNTSEESMEGQQMWYPDGNDNTSVEFERNILFVDNQYFVMVDRMDNANDDIKNYSWRFHANAGGDTDGILTENAHGGLITRGSGDDLAHLLVYTTTGSNHPAMSYPTAQHSNDILGPTFYKNHTVIQANQDGVDTEFLTVLYPYKSDAPSIHSIEDFDDHIGLLVDRNTDRYDILITQRYNEVLDIEGHTTESGHYVPSISTSANFLLVSLDKDNPENLSLMRTFGNDDTQDDPMVTINGNSYPLITDPVLSNDRENSSLPSEFVLHQNYPNPFNPVTNLPYELPREELVNIMIFDVTGREVRSLINEVRTSGNHSIQWDGTNHKGELVSTGMYIVRMEAGDFLQTGKMLFIK